MAELDECVLGWRGCQHGMEGVCWGGAESPAHPADGVVSGHLEALHGGLRKVVGPDGGTIGKGREDSCVVDFAPVKDGRTARRVPQGVERTYGGAGPCRHNFDAFVPAE